MSYTLVINVSNFVLPCRYRERGNIEVQYFNIQARLKANGQKMYTPPEGQMIHDIETAWLQLEKAEHGREVALRDELIRLVGGCHRTTRLNSLHGYKVMFICQIVFVHRILPIIIVAIKHQG